MKNITIMDIAKEAGVSKATVSRVLTDPQIVSKPTRDRILQLMDKYSYIPNRLARGLNGSPTNMIGIIIDELANFFFIEIAEGIDKVLSHNNYSMQISSSRWIYKREIELVRSLISNSVDGVLLAPVRPDSQSIEILKRSEIPFIVMNCIPDDNSVSYVTCDNTKGGELAAEYINSCRQDQIILITGFDDQSMQDRVKGFNNKISSSIPIKHFKGINTLEEGYDLVPKLLSDCKLMELKSTLFVTNDNVAIGIINSLYELKLEIPEQVSIIGYDNIKLAGLCRVPLTTISQSCSSIGTIAANEILNMVNGMTNKTCIHLIIHELVVRESSQLPLSGYIASKENRTILDKAEV